MASSTLAFLLHLPPDQAIVRMLNDANGTNYRLDRFTVSAPRIVAGTTTTVTLTSTDISPYLDDQVTVGSIDFTYERLQLALFLKGVLDNFTPTLPCSTQNLLDEITHRLDQQFYGNDILLEELTRANGVQYVLKAKPESLRFVGSITLPMIQVLDISTVFDANLIDGDTGNGPVYPNLDDAVAYITGTDLLNADTSISGGTVVQANSAILQVIQQQVPDPATGQYHAPWYADSTSPGPYNLYGSKVVFRGRIKAVDGFFTYQNPTDGQMENYAFPELCNTAMPSLDKAIVVALNRNYCTNAVGTLTIPYSSADFDYTPDEFAIDKAANPDRPDDWFTVPGDGFVAKPRLIHNSVVSISDGTEWNSYLNTLTPQTLFSFQSTPPVLMDGVDAWYAIYNSKKYTNLYNSTIVYNGQVRAEDLPPAGVGLDRVMVIDFTNSSNSLWRGQYGFYYRSPVEISGTSFSSTLGSQTRIVLSSQEGLSVEEVNSDGTTLTTSNLPAGLALIHDGSDWTIAGSPTVEGSFTYFLNVTAGSDTVFYTISHLVREAIGALQLIGTLTPAIEGDELWQSYINIEGGQAPYTLDGVVGDLPASITAAIQYDTVHLSGSWNDIGVHHFNIAISSADGQSASASFVFQASGTSLTVTASDSLTNGAYSSVSFTGNYTVVGGQAPYTYTTTSGTFPPGLLLNGGTGSVTGTPTSPGTYTWTVTVVSADGFAGTATTTLTVTAPTYADVISNDNPIGYWPCDETSGTVLNDRSGNGHNGVIASSGVVLGSAALHSGSTGSLKSTVQLDYAAYVSLGNGVGGFMPTGSNWALEAVGVGTGSFWATLVAIATGGASEQGDPGIYTPGGSWHARVSYSGGDLGSSISSATPAHVVLERNGGTAYLYVNGALQFSVSPTSWNGIGPTLWLLGSGTYGGSYGMVGSISDVALYNQALGPQKVLAHAQFLGLAS